VQRVLWRSVEIEMRESAGSSRPWHARVILCRKGKAEEALQGLREIMGKLKLTVNEEKASLTLSRRHVVTW
jgi:RNA-directed DNA polymerase